MSSLGTVYLDVKFNSAQVGNELKKSVGTSAAQASSALGNGISDKLSAISSTAYRAGRAMTIGLTVPLVAAGKVATNAFLPFEENLAHIQGLTGANEKDMALYKSTILDTSASFGVMAGDAADALYFITSSGVQGKAAIDTLNASMQASAAGLGEVTTVADFATSVMNAYGHENISAAKATDILTIAVRDGKGEPEELAASIGQVIPIAAQLGVTADQVAGSMAAVTLNGTSASSAAAQMTQVMTALLGPSEEAKNVLSNIGISSAQLTESLRNDGLIPTLETITSRLGNNTEALDKVFGNVRALRGVLGLVGTPQALNRTNQILKDTKDSAGAAEEAFRVMSQTAGFKLKQALADINTSLVDIGADVVPIGASFLRMANVGVKAFGSLPEPIQATATGILAVGAAAGPLTYIFAGVTKAADGLGKAGSFLLTKRIQLLEYTTNGAGKSMGVLNSQTLKTAAGVGVFAVAVVGATVVMNAYKSSIEDGTSAIDALLAAQQKGDKDKGVSAWQRLENDTERAKKVLAEGQKILDDTNDSIFDYLNPLNIQNVGIASSLADEAEKVGGPAKRMREQSLAIADAFGISKEKAAEFIVGQSDADIVYDDNTEALEAYGAALGQTSKKTDVAATSVGSLINSSKNASDAFFGLVSAQRSLEDAQLKVVTTQRAQESAQRDLVRSNRDAEAAQRNISDAERRRAEAATKVTDALDAQRDAQERLNDLLNGNAGKSDQLDLEEAEIALDDAKRKLAKGDLDKNDPNARKKAVIDVQRAEIALARAQQAHQKNVVAAQKDVRDANADVTDALQGQRDASQAVIDAQNAYEDAVYKTRDAQLAVEQSVRDVSRAQEDLTGVAADLAGKQEAFAGALAGANGQATPFLQFLQALKETYPEIGSAIDGTIAKFQALHRPDGRGIDPSNGQPIGPPTPSRARGGPVSAGQLYRVNDAFGKPPELYTDSSGNTMMIPATNGYVTSFDSWVGNVKGSDGGTHVGQIVVNGATEPVQTAYEIRRKMKSAGFMGRK